MVVFEERGNRSTRTNLSVQRREPTNSTNIWRRIWESNSGHIALTAAPSLHPPGTFLSTLSSLFLRSHTRKLALSHPSRTIQHVLSKEHVVLTIREIILRNPMVRVLSSLSGNLHNSRRVAKINPEPLVTIVMTCAPSAHPGTCSLEVKSSVAGTVVFIKGRCSAKLLGSDAAILHPQWLVTLRT